MFDIPMSFKAVNEEYITLPVLKKFCKAHNLRTTEIKQELLDQVVEYANQSKSNLNEVLEWLDYILKQGIKHIYIRKVYAASSILEHLQNKSACRSILADTFIGCPMSFIGSSRSTPELTLQSYQYHYDGETVSAISFNFTKLVYESSSEDEISKIIYPVFVDIDLKNEHIIGRAKSKSRIYQIKADEDFNDEYKLYTEGIIIEAMLFVIKKFSLKLADKMRSSERFKRIFYAMLKEYTFTPAAISRIVEAQSEIISNFIENIFALIDVDYPTNYEKAKSDLNIFIEKYISINYPDKAIFTKDRDAYPVKLIATDTEMTKVEQTAWNREPLQCKERFFDNKKSIDYEQTCDGMYLCYNKIDTKYFGRDPYYVKLLISKGYCVLKFESYIEEEGIQNVLSRIIEDQ